MEAAFQQKFAGVVAAVAQKAQPQPSPEPFPPAPQGWLLPTALSHFEGATPASIAAQVAAPPFATTTSKKKAWRDPVTGTIHLNKDPTTWSGSIFAYHHEVSHHVHHALDIVTKTEVAPAFAAAIAADAAALHNQAFGAHSFTDLAQASKWKQIAAAHSQAIGLETAINAQDTLAKQRVISLFDTIGGMTKGAFGFGHTKSYYATGTYGTREVFANCATAAILGWPEFKLYFPQTMAYIETRLGLST